jgi:hypothetical protein
VEGAVQIGAGYYRGINLKQFTDKRKFGADTKRYKGNEPI